MASRLSYGAIPVGTAPSGRSGRMTVAAMRVALASAALAVVALTMLAISQPDRRTELFGHYHGAYDPVTWRGCGPGGDCGAKYHWTFSSFSPVAGRAIDIDFTHDHGSYANYYDENGWVEGAHEHYPVTATAPADEMPVIEEDFSEPLPPMEYFAKMFPIERGYSNWLRHKTKNGTEPLTYAEWLAGVKKDKAEDKDDAAEDKEEGAEEGADEGAEEKAEEVKEVKEVKAKKIHGEKHPMIFADLGMGDGKAKKKKIGGAKWWEGNWREKHGHGI